MKCIYPLALSIPVVLSNDNRSSYDVINGGKMSRRTRHIDVRRLYMIQCVRKKQIKMKDVSSDVLKADLGTKPHKAIDFAKKLDLLKESFCIQ